MDVLRYVAFSSDPSGGNPAGVVLDATGVTDADMQAVAAEVGYSETVFALPRADGGLDVRYFSPQAEVPFCGHATVALAVAVAEHRGTAGELVLETRAGRVSVVSTPVPDGGYEATLTSVPTRTMPLGDDELAELLGLLGWKHDDLDPAFEPRVAFAGAWHPVLAAATRERLAALDYDLDALGALCVRADWTTVDLVWRESATVFHSRNPFPRGGVVEDAATGAAAAAFGGYLHDLALVETPATVTVLQGEDMGRPSTLTVGIPETPGTGIAVTGRAVRL